MRPAWLIRETGVALPTPVCNAAPERSALFPLIFRMKDRPGMGLRWFVALAVVFGLSPDAFAGEPSGVFHRASCTVVRYYVAKYSASAAELWARSKGATEAEIEAARRCLKGMPMRTAQSVPE